MVIGEVGPKDRKKIAQKVRALLPPVTAVDKRNQPSFKRRLDGIVRYAEGTPNLGLTISEENIKIGAIYNFSLPAGQNFREATCPGASELCEEICYAMSGFAVLQEWKYWVNWAYILLWPDRFYEELVRAKMSRVFRIHVGGDLFSVAYTRIWMDVISARPEIRFFGYTRSWQNGKGRIAKRFIPVLQELSEMENMRLVLSVDAETGVPARKLVPAAIRAWLARNDDDMPSEPVELIFRHKRPSVLPQFPRGKSMDQGATTVCPVERSSKYKKVEGKITCQNCAWCWGGGQFAYGRREDDLSAFNDWAKVDVPQRSSRMFHGFWPERAVALQMGATDVQIGQELGCKCGALVLCGKCGVCCLCLCRCP